MKTLEELALDGAKIVLTKCLSLGKNDTLTIFWDETAEETEKIFAQAARELSIDVREKKTPLEDQSLFSRGDDLSAEDATALRESRGIITCLSTHAKGTSYRLKLLEEGTSIGTRFGHMPGANLDLLAHAAVKIDYNEARKRCDDLAVALTLGEKAVLQTYVFSEDGTPGQPFELSFDLGGVNRSAITSSGIISPGTWGNIPGGETFIAPIENTAEGTFVLNGAFKNHIFAEPSYLLLHFSEGNLKEIEGEPEAKERFEQLLAARQPDDNLFNSLAELGIGVNAEITALTGTALFDEKCAGTAHIAVGDNRRYGGDHHSTIHEDLISRAPSLWIDGKALLTHGENVFDPKDWRENLKDTERYSLDLEEKNFVSRTDIPFTTSRTGKLRIRRPVAAGRVCIYTVGDDETSPILTQIYSKIPEIPHEVEIESLIKNFQTVSDKSVEEIKAAIFILKRHKLITIRGSSEV